MSPPVTLRLYPDGRTIHSVGGGNLDPDAPWRDQITYPCIKDGPYDGVEIPIEELDPTHLCPRCGEVLATLLAAVRQSGGAKPNPDAGPQDGTAGWVWLTYATENSRRIVAPDPELLILSSRTATPPVHLARRSHHRRFVWLDAPVRAAFTGPDRFDGPTVMTWTVKLIPADLGYTAADLDVATTAARLVDETSDLLASAERAFAAAAQLHATPSRTPR